MNQLTTRREKTPGISHSTEELIRAGVAENTLKAYRRALGDLKAWLDTNLNDAALAEYIAELHQSGK